MIDIQATRDKTTEQVKEAGAKGTDRHFPLVVKMGISICKLCDEVERLRGGWISVEDRPPEKRGFYLTRREAGTIGKTWFYSTGVSTGYWGGYRNYTSVTRWMPLPHPPEDGDE